MLYSVIRVITVINIQVLHTCRSLFTVLLVYHVLYIRVGSSTVTYHAWFTVLSCVIRVGSSTVTYHAWFTVLSILNIYIACVHG